MKNLTYSERLQLAASILPKEQIASTLQSRLQRANKEPTLEQLYSRLIWETFKIADLIEIEEKNRQA
ncbi:hypothetical protein ACLSZP_10500 [Avibacterium avium]|uniref:Uncharacterized protein n=1 Tax=Avibacterium paragallinarum TaxID=728 RepID=A0A2V4FHG1_AVIPA|nr:hypothetical protein [Avibacterium paragallinarum]PXZ38100.1 hypothetical protein DM482_10965 [Avibacterium paragallinarum]PXZ39681.1 hypothetical protein DM481_11230 [Avibacterium paragallinarum]UXN37527.1 hypothetical protein N8E87_03385 [Avibacterium paragallinarum]STO71337.1 Uncharacterised protein [Avibacterium paragallinarum]SUU97575.1 Uncharacterised protein [Avibacterium paragallinarum]